MKIRALASIVAAVFFLCPIATFAAEQRYAIFAKGDQIVLSAGVLTKTIQVSGGKLSATGLTVDGVGLLAAEADEVSLHIARAEPNRNPLEVSTGGGRAIRLGEAQADGTDALVVDVRKDEKNVRQVAWKDERSFAGKTWKSCFNLSNVAICSPAPGVKRLIVRVRSLADAILAGVSINVIYEVYEGYPVIRQWVEIRNSSANWLRLSELVIDDMELAPAFRNQTMLTPSERGAGASMAAFSHEDRRRGLIVASEVPSALRMIRDTGASGYNPEHFEWVLGPAEAFESEPTFVFAFSGDIIQTSSAQSLPLDRAVEGGFRSFLKKHLGIAPEHQEVPAPQWASWTNFGPDVTDAIVREQAEIASRCGFALLEVDDGWQRGLPLECIEYYAAATVNWKGSLTPEVQDRQVASWLMGAPQVFAGDLASLTKENIERYRQRFEIVKRLDREYGIYRNFQYSGVPAPTDTDWHWWGKLNEHGHGAVVVMRGSDGKDLRAINIPWVRPEGRYKVTALFRKKDLGTFTGKQLQAGELSMRLAPLEQEIIELSPQ